ncbi:hypothetical protein [Flavobacterium branchiophilum]|uniref:Uncharacterized protein n=1 Tax=Flavobacterium branchiophilum TaxID=55197 RepID=A0A2H3KFK7_9FLAO|nr:hypothetical protein [Flavobacterium branchiophilum]PDS26258.1 hypothetical protein B0A77_02800 [Flavobacterium branchiophilum]
MDEKLKLTVLIDEYKITNERIESFIKTQNTFYWQGLAIVFGLLGVFRQYKEVLLALPIVIIIYVGLFLYHYQRCLTNQIYKKNIEDKINQICGEKLLFYTDLAFNKIEKSNKFITFNILSYSVLIIISIIAFITYFTGTTSGVNKYFIVATAIVLMALTSFLILAIIDIPKKIKKINDEYIPEIFCENK